VAIGQWYRDFEQLDDAEVCRLLDLSRGDAEGFPGDGRPREPESA